MKRPKIDRRDLDRWFAGPKASRYPTEYDEKYPRHTYRIPDEVHESLKRIAAERGLRLGELVAWILRKAVQEIESSRLDLPIVEFVTKKNRLRMEE